MATDFQGYDEQGNPIYVDAYGRRIDPNADVLGNNGGYQQPYVPPTQVGNPANTADYYGGGSGGQPNTWTPATATGVTKLPVTNPNQFVDSSGNTHNKLPVAPPAYNPQPALQANFDDYTRQQGNQDIYTQQALQGAQRERQGAYDDWANNTSPLVNQIPGYYAQNAATRAGITQGLATERQGYNQQDQASLDSYNQRMNDLYATNVPDIQAAQWQSNPQDIAAQQQALGNFSSIYGGGLDYQAAQSQASLAAQAAQAQAIYAQADQARADKAYSTPADVERQTKAAEQLHGLIDGGEWSDSLKEVRDKYKGLSDPEITSQERFIMENFRQQREQAESAQRQAVMSNLGARGLRSGAAEQAGMLSSQQELGRQGVLAQLGAEANAIGRSQQAMAGWSNASAQGRASQLQAMGMYVDASGQLRDASDRMSMFNTGEQNETNRVNAGLNTQASINNSQVGSQVNMYNAGQTNAVNMHNSTIQTQNNQFNAGQQNIASANNQATRLSGAQGYATQANANRQANDYVGTFNTGQTNAISMANQGKNERELVRKQGVAQSEHDTGVSTRAGMDTRSTKTGDDRRTDADLLTGGQLAGTGAALTWQDKNLTNRTGIANSGANTALGISNVFTPSLATTAEGKNRLIQGGAYQANNNKLRDMG